jgi:hypothetical protein
VYRYDPAQPLLVSVDMPALTHVANATADRPCVAVRIPIDPAVVGELLAIDSAIPPLGRTIRGLGVINLESAILDAVIQRVTGECRELREATDQKLAAGLRRPGEHFVGFLLPARPSAAFHSAGGVARDRRDKLLGASALLDEANEPLPGDGFGDGIIVIVSTLQMAEMETGVTSDSGQ